MEEAPVVEETVYTSVVDAPVVDTSTEDTSSDDTLLGEAGKEVQPEKAVEETPEQKISREATETATKVEEKRLLEADDKTLKPEELAKKQALIKARDNSVPDKYEVKLPEGFELDTVALEALSPVFKKYNLTQAAVQEIAGVYAPVLKAKVEAQQKEAIELWEKQTNDWKAESIKMLGANAKKDMPYAAKFMDRFGGKEIVDAKGNKTNELRVLLAETKVGNHPVLVKAIIEAGKLLGEDKFVEGDKSIKGEEKSIYDHPTSQATLNYKR